MAAYAVLYYGNWLICAVGLFAVDRICTGDTFVCSGHAIWNEGDPAFIGGDIPALSMLCTGLSAAAKNRTENAYKNTGNMAVWDELFRVTYSCHNRCAAGKLC